MSRTENHFGIITEICDTVTGFEAKYTLAQSEHSLVPADDDSASYIDDPEFQYVASIDMMFKIETEENEYGHTKMLPLAPQKWAFTASFYNGGGSLSEVLDDMLEEALGETE